MGVNLRCSADPWELRALADESQLKLRRRKRSRAHTLAPLFGAQAFQPSSQLTRKICAPGRRWRDVGPCQQCFRDEKTLAGIKAVMLSRNGGAGEGKIYRMPPAECRWCEPPSSAPCAPVCRGQGICSAAPGILIPTPCLGGSLR